MAELKNDRYLRALQRQTVDRTPIWLMRQAGRYLPEYQQLRSKAGDFMTLCKTPEFACEATLQPLQRFDLDAVILFSDILTIPDAMGLGLHFMTEKGPIFQRPIRTESEIKKLLIPDPTTELRYVIDTVIAISRTLKGAVPLIGFAGSPWTLATYMVEGGSSRVFEKIKKLRYNNEAALHLLLTKLVESITIYLNAQIKAGAQSIMIFDTWGGVLTEDDYQRFSLTYMAEIIAGLITHHDGRKVPVTLFTKGGNLWLEAMAETGCDALGLDWTIDIGQARQRVGHKVALQGNMDPARLYASRQSIEQGVKTILQQFGSGNGHIFNLGHGIYPDTPLNSVSTLIQSVNQWSRAYHD